MIVGRTAVAWPPEQAAVLRSLGPALARLSSIGLVPMPATGLSLVFAEYGGFAGLPGLFWVKMLFVLTLTLAAIALGVTFAQVKGGDAGAATRVSALGRWRGFRRRWPRFSQYSHFIDGAPIGSIFPHWTPLRSRCQSSSAPCMKAAGRTH